MNGSMAVNVLIGASLAGSFGSVLQSAIGQIGTLAGAGALIGGAVSGAADFEHTLMATAITADLTDAEIGRLRTSLRGLSVPESTNQSVERLEAGFNALVSAGMDADKAEASLYAIGRTATATQAGVEDLSKTAYVLVETLGVAPDALSAELDRLAFAGKAGAFELRDMARYFPMLGAGAKNLKLQGSEAVGTMAAALQIAKRGAGDPGEAANNMANFMKALTSPEVLKLARKSGINIKKIMKQAWATGENPFDAVLDVLHKKMGSDPFKIGKVFHDAQVQNFLKPLLADYEDYKNLKADIESKSKGSVDTDYARMLSTTKEGMTGLANSVAKFGDSVGKALLPQTRELVGALTGVVELAGGFAEANPDVLVMAGHLLLCGAAFMALGRVTNLSRAALSGFTSGGREWLQGLRTEFRAAQAAAAAQPPLMTRVRGSFQAVGQSAGSLAGRVRGLGTSLRSLPGRFRAAGGAAGMLRGGLSGLRAGLTMTRVGLLGVGRAIKGLFMSNPLGWLFAAVEFGSMLYDSWEPFRRIVDKIWAGVKGVGSAIAEFFGWDDSGWDGDSSKPPDADEHEPDTAFGESGEEEVRRPVQPGTAAERAARNTQELESRLAALKEKTLEPSAPQTFKHEISLTLRLPDGFGAGAVGHSGAPGTAVTVNTGPLMAGAN